MPDQVQVADCVQDLVPDELVFVAQPVRVQDAVFIHHDRVFQRAAARQAQAAQGFHVLHETEGTGAGNLAHIGFDVEIDFGDLAGAVDRRMIELDEELQAKTIVGFEPRPFFLGAVAFAHLDGFFHPHEFLGRRLLLQPSLLQQKDKGRSRAIHDGNFFRGQVDAEVVDAQASTGRHQVLDGGDLGAILLQRGRHAGVADRQRGSRK